MTRTSSAIVRSNSVARAAMWSTIAVAFAIGLTAPAAAATGGVFGCDVGGVQAAQQPIGQIQVPGNGWGG